MFMQKLVSCSYSCYLGEGSYVHIDYLIMAIYTVCVYNNEDNHPFACSVA